MFLMEPSDHFLFLPPVPDKQDPQERPRTGRMWTYAGVMCCVSCAFYMGLRVGKYGYKLNVKA